MNKIYIHKLITTPEIWLLVIFNDFNPNIIKLNYIKVNNNDKKRFLGNNSDGIHVYILLNMDIIL